MKSELEELGSLEFQVSEAIDAYARGDEPPEGRTMRQVLDARLAAIRVSTKKLRMPNQNYISGFINGYLRAKKAE